MWSSGDQLQCDLSLHLEIASHGSLHWLDKRVQFRGRSIPRHYRVLGRVVERPMHGLLNFMNHGSEVCCANSKSPLSPAGEVAVSAAGEGLPCANAAVFRLHAGLRRPSPGLRARPLPSTGEVTIDAEYLVDHESFYQPTRRPYSGRLGLGANQG